MVEVMLRVAFYMVANFNLIIIDMEVCDQEYMLASHDKRDCDFKMSSWDMNVYNKIIVNNKM